MPLTDEMKTELLRQSRDRLPHMLTEMLWSAVVANGEFKAPPPWVAKAIEKFAGPAIEQLRSIPRLILGQLPLGEVGQFVGAQKAATAFLSNPGEHVEAAEKAMPGLAEQRTAIIKLATEALRKVSPPLEPEPSKLTAEEAGTLLAGEGRGAAAIVKGIKEEEPLTKQICMMMWLSWPMVKDMANRAVLLRWLSDSCGLKCTRELVEKICDDIGFSPAKRGRPKNPTRVGKIVGIKKTETDLESGHDKARQYREPAG